jgi:hypothetical protein
MTSTARLICPECRRENESERIFCHDCGAKLDRSAAISAKPPAADTRAQERRRLRNMFDPHRARLRFLFFRVCKMILGAFVAAGVVQMILPPDVPPASKEALTLSQIGLELESAVAYHRMPSVQFTQDQVNDYLKQVTKSKQKALSKPLLDFNRALVGFAEGKLTVTAERSVLGYSLYTSTSLAVQMADGKFNLSNKGGAIGRLPVHPQVMQYLDIVFADLWSALDRERKLVAKASGIEFHDKSVLLNTAAPQ